MSWKTWVSSLFSGFLRQDEVGLDDPTALTILAAEGLWLLYFLPRFVCPS